MILRQLRECLKRKNEKSIFDIVVYGSAVKGKLKPNDIDIAVIFRDGSLRERLDKIQVIKSMIRKGNMVGPEVKIDIKGILWEELFQEEFFGRSGIFLEGISAYTERPFSQRMGFESAVIFVHTLKDKSHLEKVKFNYLLRGRAGTGIIKMLNGKRLTRGAVQIPISNSMEYEEILQKHGIQHTKVSALIAR